MPKLPENIEVVPRLPRVNVYATHTHPPPHSSQFRECLSREYIECSNQFPALKLMIERDISGSRTITDEEITSVFKQLNECKSKAYDYCRDTFGW